MTASLRISVPDESWFSSLAEVPDSVEIVVWDTLSPQPDGYLDLVLRPYDLDGSSLAAFDTARIGVVQSQALGYDGVADALPSGGVYANAVGVHEESTAELALALTLTSERALDVFARAQLDGSWDRPWTGSLIDRRVLLLGVGGIGGQIAARLDGFGAEVVRVGTTARDDERGHVHAADELSQLLPSADVVIVAVPLSDATTHLVDDDFLAALPDGALVVNVSRGKVADTDALVRATGRIRFAVDVIDPEPLPPEHPLWTAPGVLISPHIGGKSRAMRPRMERVVRHQIDRLLAGLEPDDIVVRT